MSRIERVKQAFVVATGKGQYRKALRLALALKGGDQLRVMDALVEAAKRLQLQWNTGETKAEVEAMAQQIDGSITVTWSQRGRRPDGSVTRVVSSALIEPVKSGPGWKTDECIPDEVMDAVTIAAMEW